MRLPQVQAARVLRWRSRRGCTARGVVPAAHLGPVPDPPHGERRWSTTETTAPTAAAQYHPVCVPKPSSSAHGRLRRAPRATWSGRVKNATTTVAASPSAASSARHGHHATHRAAADQQHAPARQQDEAQGQGERHLAGVGDQAERIGAGAGSVGVDHPRRGCRRPRRGWPAASPSPTTGHERAAAAQASGPHEVGVEAGAVAGVAGGALLVDLDQQGVAVAVEPDLPDVLPVAGGLALDPVLLPRAAPVRRAAGADGAGQGLVVHPAQHQDLAGVVLLDDGRHQPLRRTLQPGGHGRVEFTHPTSIPVPGGRGRRSRSASGAALEAPAGRPPAPQPVSQRQLATKSS